MSFGKFRFLRLLIAIAALYGFTAAAQTTAYNLGRTPTDEESRAMGYSVDPFGKGLPSGSGTAKEGAKIFVQKCAACHGPAGEGTKAGPQLVGGKGTINAPEPVRTVGSFWPFAPPLWNMINRSMPVGQGGMLKPDEVYALTAFILFRNDIIKESDVMDAKSLPKIQMPNRDGFIPVPLEDINKSRCRAGTCP